MADENVTLRDLREDMAGLRMDVMKKLDIVCNTVFRLQTWSFAIENAIGRVENRVAGQASDSPLRSELEALKEQYAKLGERIAQIEAQL